MLYTEESVRANIRNREGRRVFYLSKGDTLTPGARDFLNRERIEILDGAQAGTARFRLAGGGYVTEKPEHMTHLNAQVLVSKLHPRILFRGAMDTLEAELILAQLEAPEAISRDLEEILECARQLIRCEVLEEAVKEKKLCGLTQAEQRSHSHRPQDYYSQPHFMPSASDGLTMARLNRARCAAREAELKALAAFSDRDGNVTREDIIKTLNRMSSMLYILMIRLKAGR